MSVQRSFRDVRRLKKSYSPSDMCDMSAIFSGHAVTVGRQFSSQRIQERETERETD